MSASEPFTPIAPDLLDVLRDPAAVQHPEKYGPDPGQLELVHDCWLVSKDTGYKYPIRDGIPVMLIEEGQRWQNTPVADLPVPPLPAPANAPGAEPQLSMTPSADSGLNTWLLVGGLIAATLAVISLWRFLTRDRA